MQKFLLTNSTASNVAKSLFREIGLAIQNAGSIFATLAILVFLIAVCPQWTVAQETESHATEGPASDAQSAKDQAADLHAPGYAGLQFVQSSGADRTTPPVTITLQDAIERARHFDAQFLAVETEAKISHEDRMQARNAMLPSVSATTQYLNTEGNGKHAGREIRHKRRSACLSSLGCVSPGSYHLPLTWLRIFIEQMRPRPWPAPRLKSRGAALQ